MNILLLMLGIATTQARELPDAEVIRGTRVGDLEVRYEEPKALHVGLGLGTDLPLGLFEVYARAEYLRDRAPYVRLRGAYELNYAGVIDPADNARPLIDTFTWNLEGMLGVPIAARSTATARQDFFAEKSAAGVNNPAAPNWDGVSGEVKAHASWVPAVGARVWQGEAIERWAPDGMSSVPMAQVGLMHIKQWRGEVTALSKGRSEDFWGRAMWGVHVLGGYGGQVTAIDPASEELDYPLGNPLPVGLIVERSRTSRYNTYGTPTIGWEVGMLPRIGAHARLEFHWTFGVS